MRDLQINTRVRRLFQYLEDFERGIIQIPPFQRDFVWSNEKKIELLDSLKNGYPIGTILFWQPNEEVKEDLIDEEIQSVGSYYLNNKNSNFYYILDGYQRLSTLFGCFIDIHQTDLKRNEEEWKKKFDIIYDLKEDKFEFNRKTKTKIEIFQIPLYHFIEGERYFDFQTNLINASFDENEKKTFIQKYKSFSLKLSSYDLASVDLIGGTIKQAVEIFSRLNSRGEVISDDWKVSALSFSKKRNFRFGSEINNLFKYVEKYNYFTETNDRKNKRELVLKCVANSFGEVYFDQFSKNEYKKLEALCKREDFIDITRSTIKNIQRSIHFLFEELFVIDSKLVPYNNHLIFITDFFSKIEEPTQKQLESLKKWFWITTYSNYFTIYNLSKQRLAYKEFQNFIGQEDHDPIFYDNLEKTFETLGFPSKIDMGSVRAKALALFMLKHQIKVEKLDVNLVDGYKTYRLFNDLDNYNISENTILVIDDNRYSIPKTQKDLSDWLTSIDDHNDFFINSEMKKSYKNGASKEQILQMRKELIIQSEKDFVESLGLIYVY